MEKILVTGAGGFIGSVVVKLLIDRGEEVIGIDNINDYYSTELKKKRLDQLSKYGKFQFVEGDVENILFLYDVFSMYKFETIFNLAARAGVRNSVADPFVYMRTNALGALNLLECMKQSGCKKMVMASTSSLYAGQPMPFTEDLAVNTPISPYAASKKAAEVMAYTYWHLHGISTSVVRYFTVYGPAGRPDMSPYRFIEWILNEQEIQVFGDGEQSRDFTYVDDIARGTILAAEVPGYEIINLGGGNQPVSLNYLIRKMENIIGKKAKVKYLDKAIGDMESTWANIDKAKNIMGWEPEISLEEGLKRTVEWHLNYKCL